MEQLVVCGILHDDILCFLHDSLQAGKYQEALDLNKIALKWEEKELGNRAERMVDLLSLMAEIYDEVGASSYDFYHYYKSVA